MAFSLRQATTGAERLAETAREVAESAVKRTVEIEAIAHKATMAAMDSKPALRDVEDAVSGLVPALLKVLQCCGIVEDGEVWLRVGDGLKEFLQVERSGTPLVERISRSWGERTGRMQLQAGSLMEALQRKAEGPALRLLQMAHRDLDSRVALLAPGRERYGTTPSSPRPP